MYLLYDYASAGAFHKNWPKLIQWPRHEKRTQQSDAELCGVNALGSLGRMVTSRGREGYVIDKQSISTQLLLRISQR
ncbi:hypothetical protein ACLKA6_002806 [Drosophila palustris]